MRPVYLSALGIACALGRGKQAVAKALFQGGSSLIRAEWPLFSGKTVPVAKVPFELPEVPAELMALSSRNNKLLKLALDEILPEIEKSIAKYGSSRVGIVMATSTSGMFEKEQTCLHKHRTGDDLNAYHYAQSEISSPSLFASQYLAVHGPAYTISTACSSSAKAICAAKRLIAAGICDAVVVGGVDTLCGLTLNGFDSLALLSKQVCNPFSKNRDGIMIGEGAAVFLASHDGTCADIELSGCGESSDAYHISCPEPDGMGAQAAIVEALCMAGLVPEEVCYINLHGTGTSLNDAMESVSINRIFGAKLPCSSTKALTGHVLGASGIIEAAFLWLALSGESHGKIPLPAHVWDGVADPDLPPINLCGYAEFVSPVNGVYALMSNSFAFGGSNVSLILKKGNKAVDCPLDEILPHRSPMVLIDRVIAYQDDYIHCQVTINGDSPFCENGAVPSYIAMEYMAQAIAAWSGLMAKGRGETAKIGFLLGARRLELQVLEFKKGEVLDVYGKVQYLDGQMAAFDCWVEVVGARVVHAGINVYQGMGGVDGK